MTTKLAVYNLALGHLGERKLASLNENRESKRVLDDFWDQVVAECLAEGLWNFACRTVMLNNDASVEPAFGLAYAFSKPDDWVRTVEISEYEMFTWPLEDYRDEGGYWYAGVTPLYVRFVSNGISFGLDLSLWPANYTGWTALRLAEMSCSRITGARDALQGADGITRRAGKAKLKAKSTDAMNEPSRRPPAGAWSRARRGLASTPMPGGDLYDD